MMFALDRKTGTACFQADCDDDTIVLHKLHQAVCKDHIKFQYRGRSGKPDDPPFGIYLRINDDTEEELLVQATSSQAALDLDEIACTLFRTGSLLFLSRFGRSWDSGALIFTAGKCKWCQKSFINWWEGEVSICDDCSKTCEHVYAESVAIAPNRSLTLAPICTKCNRGTPKKIDKLDIEC